MTVYNIRAKCAHDSDWHYIYKAQTILDEEIVCEEHEGSTITGFVIENIEETI